MKPTGITQVPIKTWIFIHKIFIDVDYSSFRGILPKIAQNYIGQIFIPAGVGPGMIALLTLFSIGTMFGDQID